MTEEEFQAFFDKMSDDDLERIEVLAQSTRKKRRKRKWAGYSETGGEVYNEIVSMYAD